MGFVLRLLGCNIDWMVFCLWRVGRRHNTKRDFVSIVLESVILQPHHSGLVSTPSLFILGFGFKCPVDSINVKNPDPACMCDIKLATENISLKKSKILASPHC